MISDTAETLYCRLRNRIIEHLQLVSSAEEQVAYQQSAPIAQVSNELFNALGDWVADEATIEEFTAPVFSAKEQLAIREFNAALDALALRTAQDLPYITDLISTPEWQELSSAASKALAVFQVRGMSPEHGAQSNNSFKPNPSHGSPPDTRSLRASNDPLPVAHPTPCNVINRQRRRHPA